MIGNIFNFTLCLLQESNMINIDKLKKMDIILVAGLPGSGKSYFVNHFFKETTRQRVCRRDVRKMLFEMSHINQKWNEKHYDNQNESLVRYVEKKIIEHLIEHNFPILIENNSVSEISRTKYIQIAQMHHKKIGVIYLDVPLSKCVNRNQEREDPIPQGVVINLSASTIPPQRSEGFNEVLILQDSGPIKEVESDTSI